MDRFVITAVSLTNPNYRAVFLSHETPGWGKLTNWLERRGYFVTLQAGTCDPAPVERERAEALAKLHRLACPLASPKRS